MPVEHLGAIGIVSLFSLIAMLFMIAAYRSAEAVLVAPMQYSQILWGTLFGVIFFSEKPGWNVAIGAAVIISSGVYILLRERRRTPPRSRPVLATMQQRQDTGFLPGTGGDVEILS